MLNPVTPLLTMVDGMAWKVQQMLAAIAISVSAMQTFRENMAEARKRKRRLALEVHRASQNSQHLIKQNDTRVCCTSCKIRASGTEALGFLKKPCRPQVKSCILIHPTHRMTSYRGMHYCQGCRSLYTRGISKKLEDACKAPTSAGKRTISRMRKGTLPVGVSKWPEPAPEIEIWLG